MTQSIALVAREMMRAAVATHEARTAAEVRREAADLLRRVIEADQVIHTRVDLTGPGTRVGIGAGRHEDRAPRRATGRDGQSFRLSMVTQLEGTVGTGWVLTRANHDFSAADVEAASVVLPQLTIMAQLEATKSDEVPLVRELTEREVVVLDLLAQGLSACALAHRLGISELTARKHLEHIYHKLGVHDRLSAVLCAQERGMLSHPR
jgi:DNA-binding CsgD family transcriptional regulator